MKKIAIAGTHGVGKTTLAYSLKKKLANLTVTVNSQIARTLIRNGYPLGREATADSYIQYIIAQLHAERTAENCDLFISDRTLLDPLAYSIVNQHYTDSKVPDSVIELLKSVWLLELQQYDFYAFVPIEFNLQIDGVRPEGEEYRRSVENEMLLLMDEYRVKYLKVSGGPMTRINQVCDALGIC